MGDITKDNSELGIFGPEVKCLTDEPIELQENTHLLGMFQPKLKIGTVIEF
jgi:hypothetical protein